MEGGARKNRTKNMIRAGVLATFLTAGSTGEAGRKSDSELCSTNASRVEHFFERSKKSKKMPMGVTLNLGRYVGAVEGRREMSCGEVDRLKRKFNIDSTMSILDYPHEA